MALIITKDPLEQIRSLVQTTDLQVSAAQTHFVQSVFADDFGTIPPSLNGNRQRFSVASSSLESVGLDLINRFPTDSAVSFNAWHGLLWSAYRLRRGLTIESEPSLRSMAEMVIDGLLANRQPELRFTLKNYVALDTLATSQQAWDEDLFADILRAFLLLVRKGNGYQDITRSLEIIENLRHSQITREERYLVEKDNRLDDLVVSQIDYKLTRLVALYNLARAVELVGEFITGRIETQQLTPQGIKDDITRFIFNAREVIRGFDVELSRFSARLAAGLKALVDASVFSTAMPKNTRDFLLGLAKRSGERPLLELWYSQREAIDRRLLDLTRTAVVVSMPTSAGKTLLAELAIVQSYNDDPKARIVYIAPTRALVTQASLNLRRDLADQHLKIRVATPAFELDPVEQELLLDDFNILVTTPEKLDLLVRLDHPSVKRLSLVIVDEAHNISDTSRGARLELLLATLRRERPRSRFLLLTPFANNADDLARWLAGERGTSIVLDWRPNERVVGVVTPGSKVLRQDLRKLDFVTLESAHSDCPADITMPLGDGPSNTVTKERIALEAVRQWARIEQGGVLLLAGSRGDAEKRAQTLAEGMSNRSTSRAIDVVSRFLNTEAGGIHPLSPLLAKGIAFHHAGLSSEARYFVERLVESGAVKIICATTTLAQGVHFPLSVAVIESHQRSYMVKGTWHHGDIEPWEFWNIVGRVGRTLEDSLGTIAFAARTQTQHDDRQKIQEFLRRDASNVVSSLFGLVTGLSTRTDVNFNLKLLEEYPGSSAFLQYIVHAMAVSGSQVASTNLDRILFGSLVYEQARLRNSELADNLIRLGRMYVASLFEKKKAMTDAYVKLADATGFSSPSVDLMQSQWLFAEDNSFSPDDWKPNAFFPTDGTESPVLTQVIETLSRVPEIKLGTEEQGTFSAARIARIASLWVNGALLSEIAAKEYEGDLLKCTYHIYGALANLIPWGLRAIQKVAFAETDDNDWSQLDLLPAMVFHGVKTKEAIALRMLNVPRIVAEKMAEQWRAEGNTSVHEVSKWLSNRSSEDWSRALPTSTTVSGVECKELWELLEGQRNWKDMFSSDTPSSG